MKKKIVYKIERLRLVFDPELEEEMNPNLKYCNSSHDFENMGLTVLAAVNLDEDEEWIFSHTDIPTVSGKPQEFHKILPPDETQLFGFGSKTYDDIICGHNGVHAVTYCDLLEELRVTAYGSENIPEQDFSLRSLAEINNLSKTTSDNPNVNAEIWQDKEYRTVINSCTNDVMLIKELLDLHVRGYLINPYTTEYFPV